MTIFAFVTLLLFVHLKNWLFFFHQFYKKVDREKYLSHPKIDKNFFFDDIKIKFLNNGKKIKVSQNCLQAQHFSRFSWEPDSGAGIGSQTQELESGAGLGSWTREPDSGAGVRKIEDFFKKSVTAHEID
jgi:hypothetical protein